MLLPELPPELVLEIYSYLPVQSLLSISATSQHFFKFILENETAIYHKAALLHSFILSPEATLQEALSTYGGKLYEGTNTWKEFCKRRLQLEWNWLGEGQSVIRTMHSAGDNVHRIKVDEKEEICITTHSNGGLIVSQLLPDRVLWSLPKEYVREYAHCEYSNGYVIFDRRGNTKEVWRLAEHIDSEDAQATASPPDQLQWLVSDRMERKYGPPSRGHFRPWALLAMPEWTRAYRFVYPTLLSAGERTAFLHDVRTGALVQQFDIRAVQRVSYVELSARHVLICAEDLSVYARADGALVLTIDASMEISRALRVQPPHDARGPSSNSVAVPATLTPEPNSFLSGVTAAHISADGRDLVVLYDEPAVLIVPEFERVCRKELALKDAGVIVWLDNDLDATESTYLAFDHGRVCVATSSRIVLLHLDAAAHYAHSKVIQTSARACPLPHLAACVLPALDNHPAFLDLSCVQLSDRRVFFTWNASFRPPHVEPYVAPGEPPPQASTALVLWAQPAGGGGFDPDGPERLNVGVIDFSILETHAGGAEDGAE